MKFLIPQSEGKSKNNSIEILFKDTKFVFQNNIKDILSQLKSVKKDRLKSIYGVTIDKALLLHKINLNIFNSKCAYAIDRYTGTVFKNLNWNTLDDQNKKFMDEHFYIFSGLFGMVKPLTLIPDYKLKMNVLSLQHHWNPILSDSLNDEKPIIDLLPQVHRKAYKPNIKNVITVDFIIINKGKKTAAGHFGKAVKGEFIRYMSENNVLTTDEFSGFEYDGFKWDGTSFLKEEN